MENLQTHNNTARVQVVSQTSNIFLWRILTLTSKWGFPLLINTSLNAKGKPIVNTLEDLRELDL